MCSCACACVCVFGELGEFVCVCVWSVHTLVCVLYGFICGICENRLVTWSTLTCLHYHCNIQTALPVPPTASLT